jgi:hypothetical protein
LVCSFFRLLAVVRSFTSLGDRAEAFHDAGTVLTLQGVVA